MTNRRFGLRAQVITAFGIGALLLSVLLSVVTYSQTRANLLEQRQDDAFANAVTNARGLDNRLTPETDPSDYAQLLSLFAIPEGSQQGLVVNGEFTFEDQLSFSKDELDPGFRDTIVSGGAHEMLFDVAGEPFYAVGLPLPTVLKLVRQLEFDLLGTG